MKKKLMRLIMFLLLLTGCHQENNNSEIINQENEKEKFEEYDEIEELLNSMTLDEKIGQMLIVKVKGYSYSKDLKIFLTQFIRVALFYWVII